MVSSTLSPSFCTIVLHSVGILTTNFANVICVSRMFPGISGCWSKFSHLTGLDNTVKVHSGWDWESEIPISLWVSYCAKFATDIHLISSTCIVRYPVEIQNLLRLMVFLMAQRFPPKFVIDFLKLSLWDIHTSFIHA